MRSRPMTVPGPSNRYRWTNSTAGAFGYGHFWSPRRYGPRYLDIAVHAAASRLGNLARIGIGYVTGGQRLLSSASKHGACPRDPGGSCSGFPSGPNRDLAVDDVDDDLVRSWLARDRPVLLLNLAGKTDLPPSVKAYLASDAGQAASRSYKCRNRQPWFAVPDVRTPHAFLSIMSGRGPRLVGNSAGVTCTNSVHAVQFQDKTDIMRYVSNWTNELTTLSCELEGHRAGGRRPEDRARRGSARAPGS